MIRFLCKTLIVRGLREQDREWESERTRKRLPDCISKWHHFRPAYSLEIMQFLREKFPLDLFFFAYEPIRRVILAFLTNLILTPPYTIFTDCKKLVLVLPPLAPSSAGPPLVHGAWEWDGGLSPASSKSSHVSILSDVSLGLTWYDWKQWLRSETTYTKRCLRYSSHWCTWVLWQLVS